MEQFVSHQNAQPRTSNLRGVMLGGVSALACVLIPAGPTRADQTISTSVTGPITGDDTVIAVTSTGTISGGTIGVLAQAPGQNIPILTNSGTISGGQYGILNFGTLGTLGNSNAISGGSVGIYNDSTMGTLTNGGTISSNTYGIVNGGTIGTLNNNGTISSGYVGIANHGTLGTLNNNSTIGSVYAGINNGGAIGQLTNSGTIRGDVFAIRSTDASATIGPIVNSGIIHGNIQLDHQDVTITGGSGSTNGTLTNGTFIVSNGNLTVAGGNTKLDQNINVNGGTGTVTSAGTLALDNTHSITGNFIQTGDGLLDIGIAGTSLGDYGHLDIADAPSLAGGLGLHLLGGFTLAEGQTFDLLNFAASNGDFTSLSLNGIACTSAGVDDWSCSNMNGYIDLKLSFAGSGTQLDLLVGHQVPEPAPLGLFATGLAALGLIHRRRKAA